MILLASQSPARRRLLQAAGIVFQAQSHLVDETGPEFNLPPQDRSRALARAKALSLSRSHPKSLIIGSDQVMALEGTAISKPGNEKNLRAQLLMLRGKTHHLHTTVACAMDSDVIFAHTETAVMTMRDFSDQFLENYIVSVGTTALDCAGGYEIEGLGLQLFKTVNGDLFAIQGLPLLPLVEFLRQQGLLSS
jgi:septum formation protein